MIEHCPRGTTPQQPLTNAERYAWWLELFNLHRKCEQAHRPQPRK